MAVNLSPVGGVAGQFFDNNGDPLVGGKLYTYSAGTTTPQVTYTSATGVTPNSNPIILNGGGRVPSEIWLTDGLQYKFVLYSSTDQLIGSWDNIVGINSNFVNFVTSEEVQTATADQTVFTLTTMQYQPGTNNLVVYVDGVNQIEGGTYSFVETSSTVVTFVTGLHVGALVKFVSAETLSTGVTDASLVAFTGFKSQSGSVQDLADDDGSDWIGYEPAGAGAVAMSVQDKLRETVSVKDFGAVGDGVTDDTAAIQAAIDAVDIGGTVYLFGGVFKTTEEILITKTISLVGEDARIGNVVNPLLSKSCIYASSTTDAAAINVQDCVATLKNFIVYNNAGAVIVDGIRCAGFNGSLKIYDLLVEKFLTGIRSTNNYYNTIENTSIYECDECLRFDNCFNVNLVGMKLRTNNAPVFSSAVYGLMLLNGSQVNMFGGAIENFDDAAVYMPGASNNVSLFGVYFESHSTTNNSVVIQADSFSNIIAIGCNVYMTHSERFISVFSGGSVSVRVYSRNNKIVYPTTTKTVDVYVPLAGDTTASWDVAGDNWQSPIGANVTYLTSEGVGGDGSLKFSYPIGHPSFLKPVNTTPYVQNAWTAPPTLPVSSQTASVLPTFVSFANVAGASDDPLGLHLTTWGYTPYMTVYQNGQWEKVGTRLPNQVNSTATTVAGLVTDFNALLTKLRNNGVMV
jgi:hypothetical protein